MIKIGIIDDHPLVLEGLKTMLAQDFEIGIATDSFPELLNYLTENELHVVLTDVNLGKISGIDVCKAITEQYPAIRCLAISTMNEPSSIQGMLENGASGYLLKNASKEEIGVAIKTVFNGGTFMNLQFQRKATTEAAPYITSRELEVLKLIADGFTNQEIADKLFVSITTISTHRTNLLTKFSTTNTASLVKEAIRLKVLQLD